MLDDQDLRALRRLEDGLPPAPARHLLAARAERIPWRAVILLADLTAVLTFVTGVVAADGALGFFGFLALCALVLVHSRCMKGFPHRARGHTT
ncbi:DUF3040 domain-containing protein [Amycolatopsis jiangsuensis]|uniref:DUF3040 family protein n=1 Tax=Amycolatopsis jiangsuensis TaxID=1181879 RepID=A0A840J5P0_9PSEU|nr:DUF3040 domain-containing protein [Amycolatopsis jiangsuensis]MBB4689103.1 hypothetical protein [Amycolatopsis jiangsuensis]